MGKQKGFAPGDLTILGSETLPFREYAFDVKLQAVVRVKAPSLHSARLKVNALQAVDVNHKEGDASITEVSVSSKPELFSVEDLKE